MADHGERKFYHLPEKPVLDGTVKPVLSGETADASSKTHGDAKDKLAKYINDNIIGKQATFLSPFGKRRTVYCDYTASGKSLAFIEDYIREEVLPLYGNTHTTTSVTSLQTTLFRHEARDIIRNGVNAGERDAVIFTGSGCTGAVNKLVNGLGNLKDTIVFISHHEHHSNILPFREAGASIVTIRSTASGCLDASLLEDKLKEYHASHRIIGAFNICSNVTGVLEDDLLITALLHKYGALSFWDYASAAPYVNIDVNPKVPEDVFGLCYKDAIYFSMHKFVGGCQTPGVLVAKKCLFRSRIPNGPGGGTVFFVSDNHVRYLKDVEMREEGGTPQIVESIRAGLVLKLKLDVGAQYILDREKEYHARALARWTKMQNFILLGPHSESCLPIISFLVGHPGTGLYLHFNYVVALLNDLFGIQVRGGCLCAGPYMQAILGLDQNLTQEYENILLEDSRLDRVGLRRGHEEHSQWEVLRPGVTRLNLAWFSSHQEIDFTIEAVSLVVEHGWKLLPLYRFNNETGDWYHAANTKFKDRRWLGHISFKSGKMEHLGATTPQGHLEVAPESYDKVIKLAKETFDAAPHFVKREQLPDQRTIFDEQAANLRWFVTPSEARTCLLEPDQSLKITPPFQPVRYSVDGSWPIPGSLYPHPAHHIPLQPFLQNILQQRSLFKFEDWINKAKVENAHENMNGSTERATKNADDDSSIRLNVNSEAIVDQVSSGPNSKQTNNVNGITTIQTIHENGTPNIELNGNIDGAMNGNENEEVLDNSNACSDGSCVLPGGKRETEIPKLKANTAQWKSPPKEIFKLFLEAVTEFDMIRDGDKVLVGLSGGKDSLSLLHTLRQYTYYARKTGINFTMGAVTVDPMSSAYDPRPLIPYLEQLGIEYLYEEQDIMSQAMKIDASSICAFCSRMKRGRLYAAARRKGYNVLALGQHLDDISESFLMSIFHNGRLRTMKASYTNSEGDIRIIRPFVYVRENALRHFAESQKLPIIAENCPACFEAPKERQRVKQLLAQQELLFPRLYWNLKTALYPVMKVNKTGLESLIFGKSSGGGDVINQLTTSNGVTTKMGLDENGGASCQLSDDEDF